MAWPAVGSATGTRLRTTPNPNIGMSEKVYNHHGSGMGVTEPMEDYLKGTENLNVAITELEHFLHSPQDIAISILSFAGRWTKEVRSAGD